jgi:Pyocin activator protein PrtN
MLKSRNITMKISTYFALLAEFGTAQIPLESVAIKFLAIDTQTAKNKAAKQQLPFPCVRINGQKSPWFVDAGTLAQFIDQKLDEAKQTWGKMND